MGKLKGYTFELYWLVFVIVLLVLAPERTSAGSWSHEDAADDCPSWSGWCPPEDDDDQGEDEQ